jgi:hypothetical protein
MSPSPSKIRRNDVPASRISFRLEATAFVAALDRYLTAVRDGRPRADLIRDQMRLAIRAIIDLTPPETLAQGRKAVERDITNAMSPWGGPDGQFKGIRNQGLRERLVSYQRLGAYDKLKEVWAKIGGRSGLQLLDFDPALHHRAQNSRGHVPSPQNIMVPQLRAWQQYVAQVQKQVGRARGGWAASADLVGLSVPGWVRQHAAGGSADLLVEEGKTTFTFINRSVFVPRYRETVEVALAGREKALETDARRFLAGLKTFAGLR